MAIIGIIPRRCVNLPPGALGALARCILANRVLEGAALEEFQRRFGEWLGVPHVFGTSTGRSAFQLALEALGLERGREIVFPVFTFPVIPMVARMLGYTPVFCDVEPDTFNCRPEHIEARITDKTGVVVATHLYGQPCPIQEIAELARKRNIRVLEDCAHACGARVDGRQVGTFGDVGVFSFAEGKNMPCFGGGAIATADEGIARRAREVLAKAPIPEKGSITRKAFSTWVKWLLTRPSIFGITAYQALRLKLFLGQPLMDSAVGDELLDEFARSAPRVTRMANLQAAIGLLQVDHIDALNEGARRNARILNEAFRDVPGIKAPRSVKDDHIYVYYPLMIERGRRDDLRRYLLRHGVDSKITDMSDCLALEAFGEVDNMRDRRFGPGEESILEVCVYSVISEKSIRRLVEVVRTWAQGNL